MATAVPRPTRASAASAPAQGLSYAPRSMNATTRARATRRPGPAPVPPRRMALRATAARATVAPAWPPPAAAAARRAAAAAHRAPAEARAERRRRAAAARRRPAPRWGERGRVARRRPTACMVALLRRAVRSAGRGGDCRACVARRPVSPARALRAPEEGSDEHARRHGDVERLHGAVLGSRRARRTAPARARRALRARGPSTSTAATVQRSRARSFPRRCPRRPRAHGGVKPCKRVGEVGRARQGKCSAPPSATRTASGASAG